MWAHRCTNEKSVPAKSVRAEREVRCVTADGLCVPAQTHGVGVVWEGGRGWGEMRGEWKVGLGAFRLPITEGMGREGIICEDQSMNFVNESWRIWLEWHWGLWGTGKCGIKHLF